MEREEKGVKGRRNKKRGKRRDNEGKKERRKGQKGGVEKGLKKGKGREEQGGTRERGKRAVRHQKCSIL